MEQEFAAVLSYKKNSSENNNQHSDEEHTLLPVGEHPFPLGKRIVRSYLDPPMRFLEITQFTRGPNSDIYYSGNNLTVSTVIDSILFKIEDVSDVTIVPAKLLSHTNSFKINIEGVWHINHTIK